MDKWTSKAAEVNHTLEEIKRTNKFILKRLNSQEERTRKNKDSFRISCNNIDTDGIRQLELLSRKHDERIAQVITSISSINVTITTLCKQLSDANVSKLTKQCVRTKEIKGETSTSRIISKCPSNETIKGNEKRVTNVEEAQKGGDCDSDNKTVIDIGNSTDVVVRSNKDRCVSQNHGHEEQSLTRKVTIVPLKRDNTGENINNNFALDVQSTNEEGPVISNESNEDDVNKIQGQRCIANKGNCDRGLKRKMTDSKYDNRIVVKSSLTNIPKVEKDANYKTNIKLDRNVEPGRSAPDKVKDDMEMMAKAHYVDDEIWAEQAKHDALQGVMSDSQRGNGIDTVFVLDTSESMQGDGFKELKSAFTAIIDAIESNSLCDENVGVIVFGKDTKSLIHLTNRYSKVRRCLDDITCEGSSPLRAGLSLTLGHIHGGAGTSVIGKWHVRPRIILISDGKLTDSRVMNGPENQDLYDLEESKLHLFNLIQKLGVKYPIYCVPVGDPDLAILETIAAVSNGKIVNLYEVRQLGKFSRNIVLADNILRDHSYVPMLNTADIKSRLRYGGKYMDITDGDIADMREFWSDPPLLKDIDDLDDNDDPSGSSLKSDPVLLPIGSRVKRGPDWKWENQDSDGPGTVIGYDESKKGWIKVQWDTDETNVYRYGIYGLYDVIGTDEPRLLGDELIAVGCVVKRGKDWEYGNQDGGDPSIGSVYKVRRNGSVAVRWPNGKSSSYKYGCDGKFEVEICDPFAPEIQQILLVQAHGSEDSKKDRSVERNIDRGRIPPIADGISIYDLAPTDGLSSNRDTFSADRGNTEISSNNLNVTSSNTERPRKKCQKEEKDHKNI